MTGVTFLIRKGGHEAELLFSEEPPWERFPVQIPFGNEGGKQMFRTLELSERGTELSFGSDCLVISGTEDKERKIPLEELEAVILMEPAIRTSGVLLAELANRRIPLIVCDRRYLPSGVLCPLYREGREFFHVTGLQMRAAKPLRKRLWRSIVRSKIAGQAGNLKHFRSDCSLEGMEHLVCSGDSGNLEANAAHRYWSGLGLFPPPGPAGRRCKRDVQLCLCRPVCRRGAEDLFRGDESAYRSSSSQSGQSVLSGFGSDGTVPPLCGPGGACLAVCRSGRMASDSGTESGGDEGASRASAFGFRGASGDF